MLSRSFVGSAETVRAGLEHFVEETGVDELIVASAIYNHAARLRSYEILSAAYWLELLVTADVVPSHKLAALRQECDELTAIVVTIIKQSKAAPE
jgi:hypothetical protein